MNVVALVGVDHPHSSMYLETLEALDEVGGVVFVDPDEAAWKAAEPATRKLRASYAELDAALADPAVTHMLVALPNDRVPAALVRAIDAGKPVFAEKPAARSLADFRPVLAALARRPVPFSVAYLNRWAPPIQQMREAFRGGAIGRLTSVEIRMVTTQVGMRNPSIWLFNRAVAGGGILAWLAVHWLDAFTYVTGDLPARVQAQLATTSGEPIDVEDTAAVSFATDSGAIGSLHAGYLLATGRPGYRGAGHDILLTLRGTLGAMTYEPNRTDAPLVLDSVAPGWRGAQRRTYQFTPPASPGYGGLAGLDYFRAFLKGEYTADATDALRVLETLDAIYEGCRTGQAVQVRRAATR
jgi:predicted dehydrogenase